MHSYQRRHPTALLKDFANPMPRRLGRHHADVHTRRRDYLPEPDVESVSEHQRFAGSEVTFDALAVEAGLAGIGCEDHHDLRLRGRFIHAGDSESGGARRFPAPRAIAKRDDDIDAAVSQVQRVRVPLTAVADDRDASSIETADVGVSIVEKVRHFFLSLRLPVTTMVG